MTAPRVVFLIHGGPGGIELVRAQGLSRNHPADRVHFLLRDRPRGETAGEWQRRLKELRPDLIYVMNLATPGFFVARWWRRFHGVPFVVDTGDVIYEMARSAGTHPAWQLPFLRLVENGTLRVAHTVVVRGSEHQALLKGMGLPRVELIRDGYLPPPDLADDAVAQLRAKLGLQDRFVPGVMGSLVLSPRLQICYGWDLIEALTHLRDLPVQGLVIGDGPGRPWLEALARRHGVTDRVTFCGRIPYADVPLHLRLLDVALSTQTNNLAGRVRTTGKLPEYMAAERFILASRVGEATRLLPPEMLLDYDGEVDTAYPRRLADRLRQLCLDRRQLELRQTLPAIAQEHCSYAVLSRRFDALVAGFRK